MNKLLCRIEKQNKKYLVIIRQIYFNLFYQVIKEYKNLKFEQVKETILPFKDFCDFEIGLGVPWNIIE